MSISDCRSKESEYVKCIIAAGITIHCTSSFEIKIEKTNVNVKRILPIKENLFLTSTKIPRINEIMIIEIYE